MRSSVVGIALAGVVAFGAQGEVRLLIKADGKKVIYNVGSYGRGSNYNALAKLRNRKSDYDPIIEHYAIQYGVDPVLVRAVIQVESDFNPRCVSHKNARGLMQLIPETARRYGVGNVFDPDDNIRGGVHYLSDLMEMFSGDLRRALAAYYPGEGAVIRYGGIPPYEETSTYVKRAMTVYYGRPDGEAVSFAGNARGMKLRGGFTAQVAPLATAVIPNMRVLGVQ
jgi:soluble lytic murein transglycosylase-like protein